MSESGVIRNFFADRGFGWVTLDSDGFDLFVHVTDNPRLELCQPGDQVFCDRLWDDRRGRRRGRYKGANLKRILGGYSTKKLNLHGFYVEEAKEEVTKYLEYWRQPGHFAELQSQRHCCVEIVTGAGRHSLHFGYPQIRPEVCKLLNSMNLEWEMVHDGALRVTLVDLNRSEQGRQKREHVRLEREAKTAMVAEKGLRNRAEEEEEEEEEEERNAAKASHQKASSCSERPILEAPVAKDMKQVLGKLQQCANGQFQKKHSLKGAGSNYLAKLKFPATAEIFADFQANASVDELVEYQGMQ